MKISEDTQAWIIKIAAVVTAMPRWVAALLAAEGLIIPHEWTWWLPMSAIMSACMAVVEGWAFAFVFSAWRNAQGRVSRWLAVLASLSAVVFVAVITPYIAASVRGVAIGAILADDWLLGLWSAAVALSTIAIVASVGFAQKREQAKIERKPSEPPAKSSEPPAEPVAEVYRCACGWSKAAATQGAINAHKAKCPNRDHAK